MFRSTVGRRTARRRPGTASALAAMVAPVALLLVLTVAGCGSPGSAGPGTGDDGGSASTPSGDGVRDDLAGRSFESAEGVLVTDAPITIAFGKGATVSAYGGCNHFGGTAVWDGDVVTVTDMMGTEMGCDSGLMGQDQWLTGWLGAGVTVALDGDHLTLTGGDTTLTLTDSSVVHPDRPLEGTLWRLDGIISGAGDSASVSSVPQDISPTMQIVAGRMSFNDGVNEYMAPVDTDEALEIDEHTVRVPGEVAGSAVGCADGEVCGVDMSVLGSDFDYVIDADRLTVTGTGTTAGHGLIFVADDEASATPTSGS